MFCNLPIDIRRYILTFLDKMSLRALICAYLNITDKYEYNIHNISIDAAYKCGKSGDIFLCEIYRRHYLWTDIDNTAYWLQIGPNTCMRGAAELGHIELCKILLDWGMSPMDMFYGGSNGDHLNICKYALDHGADIVSLDES